MFGCSAAGDAMAREADVEKAAAPMVRGVLARTATRSVFGSDTIILSVCSMWKTRREIGREVWLKASG